MRAIVARAGRIWGALGSRARYCLILALALGFFAAAVVWKQGADGRPRLVQAMVDKVGLRLVEGHAEAIRFAAEESGVDPLLLAAICFHESRGRTGQRSSAGAMGLMQLVPAAIHDASRRLGMEVPTDEQVLHDASLNLRLGAAHVAWLLENKGGWNLEQVLVSYNAGRGRLLGWIERAGGYREWTREQEERLARGERTSGALRYARGVLETRARLARRGGI